jgi:serine/threonine protein kinase
MPQVEQQLCDRYHLKQKLGQDASRQTWLAIDTQTQESVVVKLLAFDPQMQWEESKLFEREAQVLQTLNHPRIPQYRNYFTLDQLPDSRFPWFGLVQSYIPGDSLQALLDRHERFTPAQIEKIAIEVLSILVYLHELDPPMLHRDIKPSNLIWGTDDRIYLVDFGAVQHQAATEGATFTVVGTYGYVPIEQFGGRAVPASDLYALGATLIHLITGLAPADLPQHNGRIQFADCTSLDSGLVNWISQLVEPKLDGRFSTAREALAAFDQRHAVSALTTTSRPSGSKIQIYKSINQLKIEIPRRGMQIYHLADMTSGIQFFVLSIFITLIIPSLPLKLMFGLIFLRPFLDAFRRTHLYFDCQYLVIQQRLFSVCYKHQRVRIDKIDRISAGDDLEEALRSVVEPLQIKSWVLRLSDRLVIIAGWQIYSTNPLSKVERLWLRREIEDWLQQSQQIPNDL